tara:strand:+ start:227 stop:466 length:240 start_codon:yes stop_codon:yes gene_type:complete
MIKVSFLGKDIRFPSWDGPSTEDCPKCKDNKLYSIGGYSPLLDKPIWRKFCIKKDNPCDYYKDNMTDEERKKFLKQFDK